MIEIVTIEREYGSGGANIARKVAERRGWKLWDQLLTNEIARELGCGCDAVEQREEKVDPLYYRLLKGFLRGSFEGSINAPQARVLDTDCIREIAERVVKKAAEGGHCVIVGRGSAYYLQGRRDAFHVFVYAPFEEKVQRLERDGKSRKEAMQLVDSVDRDRAAFIKKYFDVEWPDRNRFHLMLNSTVGEDAAVETILHAVSTTEKQATGELASSR
ncbi:MAG TPA: cytidylate kinase-like family protein [Candidatus Aquilonibacter sp.]|nr:cytidylate kinase-like family protein [Candidatus Aquilonibacter sp.]